MLTCMMTTYRIKTESQHKSCLGMASGAHPDTQPLQSVHRPHVTCPLPLALRRRLHGAAFPLAIAAEIPFETAGQFAFPRRPLPSAARSFVPAHGLVAAEPGTELANRLRAGLKVLKAPSASECGVRHAPAARNAFAGTESLLRPHQVGLGARLARLGGATDCGAVFLRAVTCGAAACDANHGPL